MIPDACGSPAVCIPDMILLLCRFWAGYFQKLDNRKQFGEVSPKSSRIGTQLFNGFKKNFYISIMMTFLSRGQF